MGLTETSIEEFQSVRVLVVGDVFLDRFQYGVVERISPEAPIPVFSEKTDDPKESPC